MKISWQHVVMDVTGAGAMLLAWLAVHEPNTAAWATPIATVLGAVGAVFAHTSGSVMGSKS